MSPEDIKMFLFFDGSNDILKKIKARFDEDVKHSIKCQMFDFIDCFKGLWTQLRVWFDILLKNYYFLL